MGQKTIAQGADCLVRRLDPRSQDEGLIVTLNELTARCFGKEVPLHETRDRFADAHVLFLVEQAGTVIGYAFNDLINLAGKKVNYWGSGFIAPEAQGRGLYDALNRERVRTIDADVIMTRTQNPRVVQAFKRQCDEQGFDFVPAPGQPIPVSALAIGRAYAKDCTDGLVCPGVYGRELMAKTPLPNGFAAQALQGVNPSNGDALILLGLK